MIRNGDWTDLCVAQIIVEPSRGVLPPLASCTVTVLFMPRFRQHYDSELELTVEDGTGWWGQHKKLINGMYSPFTARQLELSSSSSAARWPRWQLPAANKSHYTCAGLQLPVGASRCAESSGVSAQLWAAPVWTLRRGSCQVDRHPLQPDAAARSLQLDGTHMSPLVTLKPRWTYIISAWVAAFLHFIYRFYFTFCIWVSIYT